MVYTAVDIVYGVYYKRISVAYSYALHTSYFSQTSAKYPLYMVYSAVYLVYGIRV